MSWPTFNAPIEWLNMMLVSYISDLSAAFKAIKQSKILGKGEQKTSSELTVMTGEGWETKPCWLAADCGSAESSNGLMLPSRVALESWRNGVRGVRRQLGG